MNPPLCVYQSGYTHTHHQMATFEESHRKLGHYHTTHTVNNTINQTVKYYSNPVVEGVIGNKNGEVQHNLTIITSEWQEHT